MDNSKTSSIVGMCDLGTWYAFGPNKDDLNSPIFKDCDDFEDAFNTFEYCMSSIDAFIEYARHKHSSELPQ